MIKKINFIFFVVFIFMLFPLECPAEQEDAILATVGSEKITQGYFNSILDTMPRGLRKRYEEMGKKKLLERIIEMKLFAHGARQIKLDEKPEVKFKIKDSVEGILAAEYIKHLRTGITIEEGDIKAYYEKHKERFHLPERVKLRHIAVKTEEDAKNILADLKKGADFAETAQKRSILKSSEKGGDLGWVIKGRMAPEIEEVAFKLEKGAISDIIQTKTGYHIIKVEDHKATSTLPLADARGRIKPIVQQQKEKQVIDEIRKKLKEELGVKIFSDKLKDTKKVPGIKEGGKPSKKG